MAVRGFDGVDDTVRVSPGAVALTGALTLAGLHKRLADGTQDAIFAGLDTGSSVRWGLCVGNTGNNLGFHIGATFSDSALPAGTAQGWAICVATRAAGTTTPRLHTFPLDTGVWSHGDGGATTGDPPTISGGTIRFAGESGALFNNCRLAVGGAWDVNMTDLQVEELAVGLHTAAFWDASAGRPKGLWQFNQDPISNVNDLTPGGANQTAVTGTTVVTGDDPPGWTFDGITASAAALPALVMAPPHPRLPSR